MRLLPAIVGSFAHRGEAEVVAAKLLGAGLDADEVVRLVVTF